MYLRVLIPALTVFGLSLLAEPARAQRAPSKIQDSTPLERRVKELEERVAKLEARVAAAAGKAADQPPDPGGKGAAKAEPWPEVSVFRLKHADAVDTAGIVRQLFKDMTPARFNIVADPRTNSLLFYGPREVAQVLEAVLAKLEDTNAKVGKGGKSPK